MRARNVTVTGNVTARCARHRRVFPLSAFTGTVPCGSTISTISKPAGAAMPGGPPGTRTAKSAFVTPALRTMCSRISAYCTSGEPLRTGRTVMSIDAAGSTTTGGPPPRCAAAGVAMAMTHSPCRTKADTRLTMTPVGEVQSQPYRAGGAERNGGSIIESEAKATLAKSRSHRFVRSR